MNKESTHTRIYEDTLRNLRHIHAETGEKQMDILDRLVADEWQRVKNENVQIQTVHKRKE